MRTVLMWLAKRAAVKFITPELAKSFVERLFLILRDGAGKTHWGLDDRLVDAVEEKVDADKLAAWLADFMNQRLND